MKPSFAAALAAAAFLAASALPAATLEIGTEAEATNLQFPWTPSTPLTGDSFPATNYFFGGRVWASAPLGEDSAFSLSYERDPVLRNSLIGLVQFDRGITRISVGPFVGLLNSDSAPFSAGLSASVRFQWPGVAYVSMRSDGGTAVSILQSGSDPQARTELAAGFYVPNAIVSGVVSAKRFNELDSGGGLVTDSLTRYAITVDAFKKNVPYTALASAGYELRSKRFATSGVTDSLGAIVLGLDASAQVARGFKITAGFSSGAYAFGLDALQGRSPASSSFFFSGKLGFSIDLGAEPFSPRPKADAETAAPAADTGAAGSATADSRAAGQTASPAAGPSSP